MPVVTDFGEIAGITCRDRQGQWVTQVGIRVPEEAIPADDWTDLPFRPAGRRRHAVPACRSPHPVASRENSSALELILISIAHLQRIVWEATNMPYNGDSLLGTVRDGRPEIFFPGRRGEREVYNAAPEIALYGTALQAAAAGKAGLLRGRAQQNGEPDIVAYAPVGHTRWGLLVTMDQADLYADVNRLFASVLAVAAFLSILGGFGIFLLLRPLTGKALVYSTELEDLNRNLQQEIADRRRVEANLRRSEEEWAQTFEAITDAVAILDRNGQDPQNEPGQSFLSEQHNAEPADREALPGSFRPGGSRRRSARLRRC